MEYVIKVKCEKCGVEVEEKEYSRCGCLYCHYMSEAALKYTKEMHEIKAIESSFSKTKKIGDLENES